MPSGARGMSATWSAPASCSSAIRAGVGGRADRDHRVDQPIAAGRLPVVGAEALELPRGVVGRRAQVRLEVGAGGIGTVECDRQGDREEGRSPSVARSRRSRIHATRSGVTRYGNAPSASVAARSVIRSRSAATRIGGSWPSSGGPSVDRRAIRGEVLAHPRQRALEDVAAQLRGEVRMAHPEAEHEPPGGRLGQRLGALIRVACASRPQMLTMLVPSTRRDVSPASRPEQRERLAPDRLRHPQARRSRAPRRAARSPWTAVTGSESRCPQTPMRPRSREVTDRCYPLSRIRTGSEGRARRRGAGR